MTTSPTILVLLLLIYLLSLVLATITKYATKSTVIYTTVYPTVTVHVTDEAQCSSLGLLLCHEIPWASVPSSNPQSGSLSAIDSTAALLLSSEWVTVTSTFFDGAVTVTTTTTRSSVSDTPTTLNSNNFGTKLNAVDTKHTMVESLESDSETVSASSSLGSSGPTTTITTTESIGEEIELDSSSPPLATVAASSSNLETSTTQNHHSLFMLQGAGSGHFVEFGPAGSVILGPVVPNPDRTVPPMFILHYHGYLTSGDDPNDIIFLRLMNQNDTRRERDNPNAYYKVIHGPKNNISVDDLTSRFTLKDGILNFFEQGQNTSRFNWYVDTSIDSISRLFMAPTAAATPEGFSQIELFRQSPTTASLQNSPTKTMAITSSSTIASTTTGLLTTTSPTMTVPQIATAATQATSNNSLSTMADGSEDEASSQSKATSRDRFGNTSSLSFSEAKLTKCPKTSNPAHVWEIVQIIARLDLRSYCSALLGYDAPTTIIKTKTGSIRIITISITDKEDTETETETYYTETVTVAVSTVYNAGDGLERRRFRSTGQGGTPKFTYLVVDKSSYDGAYSQEDEILTKVDGLSDGDINTDAAVDSPNGAPQELASFCEIDISEACSQVVTPSEPITVTKTNKIKTLTRSLTEVPTTTQTKVLLAASTTTILNTTQISYPGTGRLIADSGTYSRWHFCWTGDAFDPALNLCFHSRNATFFITEYRPNIEAYRVYTNGPDGEKYYMSIAAPIGVSAITDYSISLRTLDDINSDEGSVILYVNLDLEGGYVNVNMELTGTERNLMFGCAMVMGKELRAQVRLYSMEDGTVPRVCQAWSHLVLV
ncbi:hypothetical protein TWF718_005924 [Orbilia javanica]|uniref:Uncharacterized protein n=1 Tax=Orbilia javanica TaxID=47235 RepID=A0AAN8MSL3_9PEZI